MARVSDLMQQAEMTLDPSEKITLLHHVKELLLDRSPKPSVEEFKNVFEGLVQMATARNVDVAKSILHFIEESMDPSRNELIKNPSVLSNARLALFQTTSTIIAISAGPTAIRKALKLLETYVPGTIYYIWVRPLDPVQEAEKVWQALLSTIQMIQQMVDQLQDSESLLLVIRVLESCAMHFSYATDSVYRDPSRSNIQPDAVHLGSIRVNHPFVNAAVLLDIGVDIVNSLSSRLASAHNHPLFLFGRREYIVLLHSLSLMACLRPTFVPLIVPSLLNMPQTIEHIVEIHIQESILHTLKSNLLKLLQLPLPPALQEEMSSLLINTLDASTRACKALTKSKESRRKYVSAPSVASINSVKRSNAKSFSSLSYLHHQMENSPSKRQKTDEDLGPITVESLVNMRSDAVVQFVLKHIANLPPVPPLMTVLSTSDDGKPNKEGGMMTTTTSATTTKLELLHTPSVLKERMLSILSQLASPSSVSALAANAKKAALQRRDPRLRRGGGVVGTSNHLNHANVNAASSSSSSMAMKGGAVAATAGLPSLVNVFDESSLEIVTSILCANAQTLMEPIISVTKDEITREYNAIRVNIKPVTEDWCRSMGRMCLTRMLENEYGILISGHEALRETLICHLATNRWLLHDKKTVHKVVVDFVGNQLAKRHMLLVSLVYHEYLRSLLDNSTSGSSASIQENQEDGSLQSDELKHTTTATTSTPSTSLLSSSSLSSSSLMKHYDQLIGFTCSMWQAKLDPTISSDKKLFYLMLSHLPCITVDVLKLLASQFDNASESQRVVMGVSALRNFILERTSGQEACLQILLHFATHSDESIRNPTIRCLANQIYPLPQLHGLIEAHASNLMDSCTIDDRIGEARLDTPTTQTTAATHTRSSPKKEKADLQIVIKQEEDPAPQLAISPLSSPLQEQQLSPVPASPRRKLYLSRLPPLHHRNDTLLAFANSLQYDFSQPPENEGHVHQRIQLFLALCAKKPDLLQRYVATYARATPGVQHVLVESVDKLIKLLKHREGDLVVLAQLQSFPPAALEFVCHVIRQIVSLTREGSLLLEPLMAMYRARCGHVVDDDTDKMTSEKNMDIVPDAIAILVPIVGEMNTEIFMPLLPQFFQLSMPRIVEVMSNLLTCVPMKVDPATLLLALHHISDDVEKQKSILKAIGLCLEHQAVFTMDVMTYVTSTLVSETPKIPKFTMRTMIQTVQLYPKLRKHTVSCLETLIGREIWAMEESESLWKGFQKCCVVLHTHAFPILLRLPLAQGQELFELDEAGKHMFDSFKAFCAKLNETNDKSAISDEWRRYLHLELKEIDSSSVVTDAEEQIDELEALQEN